MNTPKTTDNEEVFNLAKVPFADDVSRKNYEAVMAGTPMPGVRNPLVIITANQPGLGKSFLAEHLIRAVCGVGPAAVAHVGGHEEMGKVLEAGIFSGLAYLLIEDVPFRALACPRLASMATEAGAFLRLVGSSALVEKDVVTKVFLTLNGADLPEAIVRRSRLIELFHGGEWKA